MSVNSDAVGKDVGGGIVLEIVIGIALPIRDGLCHHTQESAPPTVVDDVGSFAPPPRWRSCGLRPSCRLRLRHHRGQRQGASNAAATGTTVIIAVSRPRGRRTKDDTLIVIFDVFQEDDESSASELIVGKSMLENAIEATARHPLPCWGEGGRSELTRKADKRDGSKSHGPC